MSAQTTTRPRPVVEEIRALVQKHRVCYEVWPELLMVNGERVQVGFALELSGAHEDENSHIRPGCEHCVHTYEDLLEIARWIMPEEERASYYEIQPCDYALHEAAKRKFRPDVVLSMKILHRHGFDQPVDQCEERCLGEMRGKLKELGVPKEEWPKH